VFVTVNVVVPDVPCSGTEPKFLLTGLMVRPGGCTPVPVRFADALAVFELVAVNVPDLGPEPGAKCTVMQAALAASVMPLQALLSTTNSPAWAPPMAMLLMGAASVPRSPR
jgi:hypothetical protein